MLVRLGTRSAEQPRGGAIDMLLDCHERIRRFSDLSVRMASSTEAAPAEIRGAAQLLHRYFTIAFPLHVDDEERSLRPRLKARELSDALETMSDEHVACEAELAPLVRHWADLIDDPTRRELLAISLSPARRLQTLLLAHLRLEESVLFPAAAKLLSPSDQDEVAAEMRARRLTGDGGDAPPRRA
jgi:hemerythrin-like domain-containing protein